MEPNSPAHTDSRQKALADVKVSVVIVTYNSEEQIAPCLKSLHSEVREVQLETVVVDNGSQDSTVSIVKSQFPSVVLLDTKENLGFAKACNLAVQKSTGDFILLLNPDTVTLDGAVDKVVKFALAEPSYGFYGGQTLKEDGVTLERSSCWGLPSLWSMFTFATGLSTIFKHNGFFDPESLGKWKRDSVREVGVITGCFLLATREAWDSIEGFDEHFWLYGEDVDLSLRAKKAGYHPVIYPKAKVIHEIGQSSTSAQKGVWLQQGKVSYLKRNWSAPASFLGLILLNIGVAVRAFAYGLKGDQENQWVASWKRRSEWKNGHTKGTN
ncbi:glycosyltransferase family 2 protein [Pelagicoccus albus]|uniref:Glycosyltransferase family 2 protein n=1 Tax=Pelagicoccus albus TaxID=415222 RepID=A0A7X1B9N4_9BACT|nr:glycosyltransferase family 2 protein [Pelagicoccus albus]MBC2608243.1 glycosyltransferase family 2 protein [Pelagicoccus albus]